MFGIKSGKCGGSDGGHTALSYRREFGEKKPGPEGPGLRMPAWGPANFRGELLRRRRLWEEILRRPSARNMIGARIDSNVALRMTAMRLKLREKRAGTWRG